MSHFLLERLQPLLASQHNASGVDYAQHLLDDWEAALREYSGTGNVFTDGLGSENGPEQSRDSVLELYRIQSDGPLHKHEDVISRLLLKTNGDVILESLSSLLSCDHPNDEISSDVADAVGFDDMDLVVEILDNRDSLKQKLEAYISGLPISSTQVLHGSTKGKTVLQNARQRMADNFRTAAAKSPFSGVAQVTPEIYPHVYTPTILEQGNVVSHLGSKYMLPLGTARHMFEVYEEVIIPPAKPVPPRASENLIPVSKLDMLAKGCFPGYLSLNRIQSIVYPTAYGTNENMLVCAPTGAGKTDVAMLTILRVINQHRWNRSSDADIPSSINRLAFKIIYVAPMKALASEIVRKLSKRLSWLSMQVRELTGDMQLTKQEISQTQIIVTTPEKWDVVTRKPTGEGELSSSLKLLIIDEVHLLNEERGAVIETIVARTLRQVESSQSLIRIVGLSATLPNYVDVAEFLSVSKYKGLFYFDSSFRPVPLEQHFIGIKGKPGSALSRKNLDHVTFQKVSELVSQGHQVMVFVHARKETVKTAMGLQEMSVIEGNSQDFSCEDHPQWSIFRRNISESRNKEMKQLFSSGFGIHHAGMLRSDRNLMERMFSAKAIKVLCCTATLAWGVNLPAHAVIIKGTQIYDSSKGSFVDLSVLDVLQIFGRAGRPGLESSGEGYICTTEDKLTHFLDAITSQIPIESQFQRGMIDALNAEISLGTVASAPDAVKWLGYTYLFVRMRKNPFIYGIARENVGDDPRLGIKRNELVTQAAQKLADARMIVFDTTAGSFSITELGRIAAKYYIRYNSIEIFNSRFRPTMSEADILAMLSLSTEFDQIQIRENEVEELKQLMELVPCDVKDGTDTSHGKVNILLQGFISRCPLEDFALVSDMAYIAQNSGRIVRALLEIAISRKWAKVTTVLMGISKAIEKRLWPFDHPLKQFTLKPEVIYALQNWAEEWSVAELASLDAPTLGALVHLNEQHGLAILNAAKQLPSVEIGYKLQPLGMDVLKIAIKVKKSFDWNNKVHGTAEPLWLWVEDEQGVIIFQLSYLVFRSSINFLNVDFVISVPDGHPPSTITVRWVSDRWIGADDEINVSLESLLMPSLSQSQTALLDVPLLPMRIFGQQTLENIFSNRLSNLNPMQTQAYWTLVNTKNNALFCAPCSSGKTTMAQILIWSTIIKAKDVCILFVTPQRSRAIDIYTELQTNSLLLGVSVTYLSDQTVLSKPKGRFILVATANQLVRYLMKRNPPASPISGLSLVVCDNLELLDATYELSISLLRHATQALPTRFTGFSNSLYDPADLADWLEVGPHAIFSFHPRNRNQSLSFFTQTFTIPYSASLFKAMAKPAHAAIQKALIIGESALVFVPSRGHCRSVALELIMQCTLETERTRGYLPSDVQEEALESFIMELHDSSLADFISRGVGFYHNGMHKLDWKFMLEKFAEGLIRVLIVSKETCWTLPVRAAVVVVMGTQYVSIEGEDRQVRDYGLAELVRMQSRAVRHMRSGHFFLFCQSENLDTFQRFLNEGLPLESQLLDNRVLEGWCRTHFQQLDLADKINIVDALSFTYLARRIVSNPSYYGFDTNERNANLSRVVDVMVDSIQS